MDSRAYIITAKKTAIKLKLTYTRTFEVVWSVAVTGDVVTQANARFKFRAQDVAFVEEEHQIRLLQKWI